jgi:hypothetical protein
MEAICQKCQTPVSTERDREKPIFGPRDMDGVTSWGYTCTPCARQEPEHWREVLKGRQTFLKRLLSAFLRRPTERAAVAYKMQLISYDDLWRAIKAARVFR